MLFAAQKVSMEHLNTLGQDKTFSVSVSQFEGASGVKEANIMVRPLRYGSIEQQLDWVLKAYQDTLKELGLDLSTSIFRRFFVSDLPNQHDVLSRHTLCNPHNSESPSAVSWIGQPPLPPARIALWAYHISDPCNDLVKYQHGSSLELVRPELSHHWTTGLSCPTGTSSYTQTRAIFEDYLSYLEKHDMTLLDNTIRTWLFVQSIDANYRGLVESRRKLFYEQGLTPDTHFITSSGIDGTHVNPLTKVVMDAYSVAGIQSEQILYLSAPDHLGPTHLYGVTFERGTSVSYKDRKQVIISGTASIDPKGTILHPGNVARQLVRTLDNFEALLNNGGAEFSDMSMLIVYLRDHSDQEFADQYMRSRFGDTPFHTVVAPVCRPGWLIEVEGIAIVSKSNPGLPSF